MNRVKTGEVGNDNKTENIFMAYWKKAKFDEYLLIFS
jgi:hypothetical protein